MRRSSDPVVNGASDVVVKRSAGQKARLVLGVVLIGIAAVLIADNRQQTRVGYVFGDVNAPLIVVLVVAAVFGAVIGLLLLHRSRSRA